jgi:hypothetical protein
LSNRQNLTLKDGNILAHKQFLSVIGVDGWVKLKRAKVVYIATGKYGANS